MKVSTTEVKNNLGKYIRLAAKEDIIITRNGKGVAKLILLPEEDMDNSGELFVRESTPAYSCYPQKVSYEEFLQIRANSEERFEYIDGEIYLMASPKITHQKILFEMSGIFYNWFIGKKCTPMFAPFDIELKRNTKNMNMVQPDLMVICDLEEKRGEDDYYKGVPVLVVEIISDSSKSKDYVKKMDLYMSCGVIEYWIVDPGNNEIHVYFFKDGDIAKSRTFNLSDCIRSFYFEGLEVKLGI